MYKLLKYLKRYRTQSVLGLLFKLIEAVFELIIPLIMAKIIDVGIKNEDINYVFKMGGIMISLGILGYIIALFAQFFAAKASQGFGTVLRNELFSHIQNLSSTELDNFGASTLITRLTIDINQLQICVAMTIRLFLRAPFLVIGAIIMAFSIDFKLAGIFLISTPLIAIIVYFIMAKSIPFYKKIQKNLDKISLITKENLSGVRVIKSLSKQEYEKNRFEKANNDFTNASGKVGKISALLNPITYVIMNLAILAIIWFGGKRVNIGALTQGEIVALVSYMTQILFALIVVANLVIIYMKSFASASRVNEIFETVPTVVEGNFGDVKALENAPKIAFRNVIFSYKNSSQPALKNISFNIFKGQTIGIIGGTGSGKTTMINLIARFYDVTFGEILFDGVNIKEYSFEQLRSQIGLISQKSVLFSGTIRDNLKIGNKNATDEEIREALKTAQALDFVNEFKEGIDKLIAQKGRNVSGGQRQRLTIARALVSNPEILILDDSSSSLDYVTDANLRKAIKAKGENLTLIIVSQRANSLKNSDQIIVLDDGEIVGIGKHNELLKNCEIYQEICQSQES